MAFLLKVLSGPHLGAEVLLEEGSYVLGGGEACDICLSGILIAEKHLRITVEANSIKAEPLAEPVYLDGKLFQAPQPLELYHFLTLGTTHLVLGSNESTWPPLVPPTIQELQSAESIRNPDAKPSPQASEHIPKLLKRAPWKSMALVVFMALALPCSFAAFKFFNSKEDTASSPYQSPSQMMQAVQKALKQAEIKADVVLTVHHETMGLNKPHSKQGLDIFVQKHLDYTNTHSALQNFYGKLPIKIYETNALVKAAQIKIAKENLDLEPMWIRPNTLQLSGLDINTPEVSSLIASLSLPQSVLVSRREIQMADLLLRFKALVKRHGLKGILSAKIQANTLILTGRLSIEQKQAYAKLLRSCARVLPMLTLKSEVEFEPEIGSLDDFEKLFDTNISLVHIAPKGGSSWLGLGNGRRYFVGSQIFNGWILTNINLNYFVIKKDKNTLIFKHSKNPNHE